MYEYEYCMYLANNETNSKVTFSGALIKKNHEFTSGSKNVFTLLSTKS